VLAYLCPAAIVDFDSTVFVQLALFLCLMFVVNRLLFQPMLALFQRRREETDRKEEQARAHARDADTILGTYLKEMQVAQEQGTSLRNKVRDAALDAEAKALAGARGEAAVWFEREVARLGGEIAASREASRPAVDAVAAEVVKALAQSPDKAGR